MTNQFISEIVQFVNTDVISKDYMKRKILCCDYCCKDMKSIQSHEWLNYADITSMNNLMKSSGNFIM